jgi:hypothetical protein
MQFWRLWSHHEMRADTSIGILFGLLSVVFLVMANRTAPRSREMGDPAKKALLRTAFMFAIVAALLLLRNV